MVFGRDQDAKKASAAGAKAQRRYGKMSAHRDSAVKRKKLELAAWWVVTHKEDALPPGPLHRALQEVYKEGKAAFMKNLVLQTLPPAPREQPMPAPVGEVDKVAAVVGDSLARVDQWLLENGLEAQ